MNNYAKSCELWACGNALNLNNLIKLVYGTNFLFNDCIIVLGTQRLPRLVGLEKALEMMLVCYILCFLFFSKLALPSARN